MTTATSNGSGQQIVIRAPELPTALGEPDWHVIEPAPPHEVEDVAVAAALAEGSPKELDYRDEPSGEPVPDRPVPSSRALDNQAIYEMVREVVAPHSGDEPYS